MYLSFIRNRGQKNKSYGGKIVVIIAVIILSKVVFNIFTGENIISRSVNVFFNFKDKIIYNLYMTAVNKEYNICGYSNNENNRNSLLEGGINKSNNLYSYIEEKSNELELTFYDPSYTYSSINDTILVSNEEDISEKETEVKNTEEESTVKEETDDKEDNSEEYVAPTMAENGIKYSMEQLSDFSFLMNKLYIVPSRAKVLEEELVAEEMLEMDMQLKQDNSKPQILIYHTHSQEGFADSVKGKPETHIVGVGEYLCKLLTEEYGYNVIHCKEQFDLRGGKLDRSKAYTYAEETLTQILEDYPSIEIVIDLHRDGLPEGAGKLVTEINGKQTAKIMFFNGVSRSSTGGDIDYLYNRYKKENLAFSFQLKLKALECYPDFTRKNYIDAYQYNQHLRGKSILVEAGAQNNTLQEELNAMEVLAEVLHQVIN